MCIHFLLQVYLRECGRPYVVYFRAKGICLNAVQTSKNLTKRFSYNIANDMVGTGKLRVTLCDRKQAKEIVAYQRFTVEYYVKLPILQDGVMGKIPKKSLACEVIQQNYGRFNNPYLPTQLECRQLQSVCHLSA